MTLLNISLDDKFTKEDGRIYLNGTQALVRLTLMQRRRDLAADILVHEDRGMMFAFNITKRKP